MKFLNLTLNNFGPYFGSNEIDLDTDDTSPVVLVYGENMRGKTHLFRAIRWALYGHVNDQSGDSISESDLLNQDVRKLGGAQEMSIALTFEESGVVSTLRRWVKFDTNDDLVAISERSSELKPENGPPFAQRDVQPQIARLLHEDISDFFLFDGEMLKKFEERLRRENEGSQLVRESIDRIIGIPAIDQISGDLSVILNELRTEQRNVAKANQSNEKAIQDAIKLDSDIEVIKRDLENTSELLKKNESIIKETEKQLESVGEIRDAIAQRNEIKLQVENHKESCVEISLQIKASMEKGWASPLKVMIEERHTDLEERLDRANQRIRDEVILQKDRANLLAQTQDKVCNSCGSSLNSDQVKQAEKELISVNKKIEELGADEDIDVRDLERRCKILRTLNVNALAAERIRDLSADLNFANLEILEGNQRIRSLSEKIENNSLDIGAIESQRRIAQSEYDLLMLAAEKAREDLASAISKKQKMDKKIDDLLPLDEITAQIKRVEDLHEIFTQSKEIFRETMRLTVEATASRIFREMITEPEYSGLKISPKYSIDILDENGAIAPRTSSGGEQVRVMALIGALISCAVRQGPLVIDTPFGRLDKPHRERVLKWVQSLNSQVILFVQSGEFERESDLHLLGNRVGREYVLHRISSTRTAIRGVHNG
jgi:DNA sulfur modification protein DndD